MAIAACVDGCGSCRRQMSRTATGGASRSGRNTMPSRRYCVTVPSVVMPTLRPVAITASQSSMSWFVAHDGAGEAVLVDRGAHHREIAGAFGQAAGGGVGPHQVQLDVGIPGRPAALELRGVPADGRPGMAEAQPGVPGGGLGHQVIGLGQQVPGPGQDLDAGRGRGDAPAGPVQQPGPEYLLQRDQGPGHRRLGDAQLDGGVGEAARVHDGDQAAQVPQLKVHALSV
jgi:hypothetical protein